MRFIGLVMVFCVCSYSRADLVTFEIDQSQSSLLVIASASNSQGEFDIDFGSTRINGELSTIFDRSKNLYQINGLNFRLSDGLDLFFNFSQPMTMSSIADDIRIDLNSFSAAEGIGEGNSVQFGNQLRNYGQFAFSDNSLLLFDRIVPQDFVYNITREGDLLKLRSDLYFEWNFTHGDIQGNIQYQGSFVAYGTAVPEPSSASLLLPFLLGCLGFHRRRA